MASPATPQTVRPLDTLAFHVTGPPPLTRVVDDHLGRLGARRRRPDAGDRGAAPTGEAHTVLSGDGFAPVTARAGWGPSGSGGGGGGAGPGGAGGGGGPGRGGGAPRA
ncbi:hypothetical protein ACFU8I_25345, partial [Streptomyces sp. NPDC057540]